MALLALAVGLGGPLSLAQAAAASTAPMPPANVFVLSGALTGQLHSVTKDCKGAGPAGVTLTIPGNLQGSKASTWVIQVVSLNNGTYTLHTGSVVGVTVSDIAGDEQWGLAQHGTLSVNGATGSVDAQLSGSAGSSLHLAGAWDCRP